MEPIVPIAEVPWRLHVNGAHALSGTFTPGLAPDLGAGRLLGEGFVRRAADLESLVAVTEPAGVVRMDATIDPALEQAARSEMRHRAEHGCGLRHFVVCDPAALGPSPEADIPGATEFAAILRQLFAACDARFPNGGIHAAALWDGLDLRHQAEDAGRHNAVDRVLGASFRAGSGPAGRGLVLSARISGQMAMAAARAGVAWIASRSVATSLAVEIARVARLPLIVRAGRDARLVAP